MEETRLTIEIEQHLKQEFKAEVARRGTTLKDAIEDFIHEYIQTPMESDQVEVTVL